MEQDYIKESIKIREFLDEMLLDKVRNVVEFKSAKGGFPGSFWETYSSFANTDVRCLWLDRILSKVTSTAQNVAVIGNNKEVSIALTA